MATDNMADTVELEAPNVHPPQSPPGSSALVHLDLGALSHPGKVRQNNEDSFLVLSFDRSMRTLATNLPDGWIKNRYAEIGYAMLVADGMGGAVAGEIASRTAISALIDLVIKTPDWIMRLNEESTKEVVERVKRRFHLLKVALADRARNDPALLGMGTTMTLAASLGADCLVAHVGDSRAYLFRAGMLHRLTRDQTIAQTLADAGVITPEEAAVHPMRHVLTGAIATEGGQAQAEVHHMRLKDGDQLLLCSDGLTEMVSADAIADVLRKDGPAAEASQSLIDLALAGGGVDNVTVLLGRYKIPNGGNTAS